MTKKLDTETVSGLLPIRYIDAHKGDGGRLLIIGGSIEYHGAPILMAAAALRAGCDLVYLYVPECNFDTTRNASPDFIVQKYAGEYFSPEAAQHILEFAETCTAVAIGPGLGKHDDVTKAVSSFVQHCTKPTVVDADALLKYDALREGLIVTPHAKELERFTGDTPGSTFDQKERFVSKWARKTGCTILMKGAADIISSTEGETCVNETGNPGMTVGGTGDVLAGVTASFLAQGVPPYESAQLAAYIVGAAGDRLYRTHSVGYTASDVSYEIAHVLAEIRG